MRIAIVEDNPESAKLLQSYLTRFGQESDIEISTRIFSNGVDFMTPYLHTWDLILLDIEMPFMDGLTVARQIRTMDTEVLIIFITHMAQYAIAGYEVNALDYILKPVSYIALNMKLKRAAHLIEARQTRYIVVQNGETCRKVFLNTIRYVEVFNHTLYFHTTDNDISSTGSKTIKLLEEELTPYGFFRCHQGYLVNLHHVTSFTKTQVYLNTEELPISRNRRKTFLQALMTYWEGNTNK